MIDTLPPFDRIAGPSVSRRAMLEACGRWTLPRPRPSLRRTGSGRGGLRGCSSSREAGATRRGHGRDPRATSGYALNPCDEEAR
jgi:hypothetical protein